LSTFLDPIIVRDTGTIGTPDFNDLITLDQDVVTINGTIDNVKTPQLGPATDLDLIQLTTGKETINGDIQVNDSNNNVGFLIHYNNTTKTLDFTFVGT